MLHFVEPVEDDHVAPGIVELRKQPEIVAAHAGTAGKDLSHQPFEGLLVGDIAQRHQHWNATARVG